MTCGLICVLLLFDPSRDVNDLLAHGYEALARGQYSSPDMISIGDHPRTCRLNDTMLMVVLLLFYPYRDVNDLLVHGYEALAHGQYISPDMISTGDHPRTGMLDVMGLHFSQKLLVPPDDPGGTGEKMWRMNSEFKRKGADKKRSWKPSSKNTKVPKWTEGSLK
jgi:hypothetical protein